MEKSYQVELEFDPVPEPFARTQIHDQLKDLKMEPVMIRPGVFHGFMILGGRFCEPNEMHNRLQQMFPYTKLTTRWLDRTNIPWHHVFDPNTVQEAEPKLRHVSSEEYERIYEERLEALDALPGGRQGANPDMSDLDVLDEDEDE